MMRDTDSFIRRLAERTEPVRPLSRPSRRTAAWLALSIPYVAMAVLAMTPRRDLMSKISEPLFVIEELSALATGVAAAAAAFATTVPGTARTFLVLPLLPLAVWLGSLGRGCLQDWLHFGPHGLALHADWICLPATVVICAVPAIAMAAMLRRGAPLTPHLTTALGGLAAGGLGNFGLRLHHPQDASVMVLVWQVGSVFVLCALTTWAGRYLLNWRSVLAGARRGAGLG